MLLFSILICPIYICLSYCRSVRYIPFPPARHDLPLYARLAGKPLVMAPTTYDGIVTVDVAGRVRLWETGVTNLVRSLEKWKGLIGEDYQGSLQVRPFTFISVKRMNNNRFCTLKYARLFVRTHYMYYSGNQSFFSRAPRLSREARGARGKGKGKDDSCSVS